jgi:hypothetical protein
MKSYKKIALMLKKCNNIIQKQSTNPTVFDKKKPFKFFNLFILMNYN